MKTFDLISIGGGSGGIATAKPMQLCMVPA